MTTVQFARRNRIAAGIVILLVLTAAFVTHNTSQVIRQEETSLPGQPCPHQGVDWKAIDAETIPAELIMEYFSWSNRSSCKLSNDFGGIVMNRATVKRIMGKVNPFSKAGSRYPGGLDGQYAVCLDPQPVAPPPEKCLVYSFGINNEWSFDDAMVLYGCQVFAFDPSMTKKAGLRPNIHFNDWAISEEDDPEYKSYTLSTIYEKSKPFHGDAVIDYLKIDIEHEEWLVIPQIVKSGMLDKVRQLSMEIHVWTKKERLESYREFVRIVKSLEDYGMVRFDSKYAPWCPARIPVLNYTGHICYQIAWYNSRYL